LPKAIPLYVEDIDYKKLRPHEALLETIG